jgi:hypothetical protein
VQVKLLFSDLNYDEIFVRYPYDREFVLVNKHKELSAKYEILKQVRTGLHILRTDGGKWIRFLE